MNYNKLMKLDKNNNSSNDAVEFEELIEDKKHMDFPDKMLDDGFMPFSFIKDAKTMRDSLKSYKNSIKNNKDKEEVYDFLDGNLGNYLDTIFEYEFPVVILPKELTLDAVCKVFQTINSTGLKLSVFDICVAKFTRQDINLKSMVDEGKEKKYVNMVLEHDETLVLQTIALLAGRSPKRNKLADSLKASDINDYWNKVIDSMEDTMKLLDTFGAGTTKTLSLLPYKPVIPLITAILVNKDYRNMKPDVKSRIAQKIKVYFFYTALASRYTEGTDNKLKEDYQMVLNWITSDTPPSIISNEILWNTSKYIETLKNSAFGKAILCLINGQKPRDFYSGEVVGFGELVVPSQIHHIFPEARYKNKEGKLVNSVFNYTFLTNRTNNFISDSETTGYIDGIIKESGITEDYLKEILSKHLIDEQCYKYICEENYQSFLEQRAECIKNKFIEIGIKIQDVEKNKIDEEVDDEDLTSDTE